MAVTLIAPISDGELAQAAIAGDGDAFAALYDRHERRALNLAYRITGSRDDAADATQEAVLKLLARLPGLADRELDFGAYLLTAVRHCSYDVIARAGRADPSGELPETARPVGAACAPPPEDEPDRSVLLAASQEEIRAANATLAPRQREALALRELEGLSYDEIAELMAMNRNSVAQLISRARIALRDALRRTALRSIVPGSPDCERALPLIAMRDDGELAAADDAGWLEMHLARCQRCVLGREAMAEAGASYRAWAPITAFELLRRDTIAHAGELLGHDWSAAAARAPATGQRPAAGAPSTGSRPPAGAPSAGSRPAAGAPSTGSRPAGARGVWRKTGNSHRFFARPPAACAAFALCALIVAAFPGRLGDGQPSRSVAAAPAAAMAAAPAARAPRGAAGARAQAGGGPAARSTSRGRRHARLVAAGVRGRRHARLVAAGVRGRPAALPQAAAGAPSRRAPAVRAQHDPAAGTAPITSSTSRRHPRHRSTAAATTSRRRSCRRRRRGRHRPAAAAAAAPSPATERRGPSSSPSRHRRRHRARRCRGPDADEVSRPRRAP